MSDFETDLALRMQGEVKVTKTGRENQWVVHHNGVELGNIAYQPDNRVWYGFPVLTILPIFAGLKRLAVSQLVESVAKHHWQKEFNRKCEEKARSEGLDI